MQPAVEVSAKYSASFNSPGRCNLVGSVHKRRKRIVAETIRYRCRSEPLRDTQIRYGLWPSVSEERSQVPGLQMNFLVTASDTLKNISPQSVSLILYHTNEKTTRRPLPSLFPGNQHICAAGCRTIKKYNSSQGSVRGEGLHRLHPRPHGISGVGCAPRSCQRYPGRANRRHLRCV